MLGILRSIFGGELSPVEHYERGEYVCSSCSKTIPIRDAEPLTLQPCPKCLEMNFIPKKIGDFWLYAPLGGGGMGSVYRARHPDYRDETFAVKVLRQEDHDDAARKRNLTREIRIMRTVGFHPCIASVVGSGTEGRDIYLATRYIPGERLDQRISRLGMMPERDALLIGLRLLSAVAHVYDNGYLYRDMKPENVIISENGAHLFDFGICVRIDEALEMTEEHVQGSALYYPPERLSGAGERPNSEIYSLGMVLYHAMTGAPYFTAKDIETMTTLNVRKNRLKRQNDRAGKLRPDVKRIIDKMIRRNPEERYQSFIKLEHDMMEALLSHVWKEFSC